MKKRKIRKSIVPLESKNLTGFTPLDKGTHPTGFTDEDMEWLNLTPAQRIKETTKLWKFYIAVGGSLDAEPDSQSPFYFKEASS